jgi:endonuclease/exonuclease/phosphatase family metal-dependent hydrolase
LIWKLQELIDLYKSHFSQKYSWSQLERTGDRGDGLVTLVKQEIAVRDKRDIIFRDLGDRVAMLVRLQIPFVGEDGKETNAEVVVVNTHLLFPHKPYFSIIRLRELRKILGFLELYRLQHRRDLPILMMGDFNGCPNEATYTYMAGRNFSSSCERDTGWVTHKNHLGESVCVDYIWLQNPSDRSGPIDHGWTDMLFRSTRERILSIGQPDLPVDMGLAPGAEGGDPPTVNVHDDNVTAYRETLNLLGFGVASDGLSDRDLQMLMEGPDRKFRGQDRVLTEKDLFSLCDVNSSGGLDFTEFKKFIKTLGVPNTGGSMHRNLFDSIDKSKKGHIDSAEFEEWWVQNTSGGSENSVLSKVSMEAVEVALCAMSEGIEVNHESDAAVLKDDQDDSAETSGMDLSMKMLEMCELERVTSELTPKVMEIGKFTFDLSDHAVVTSKFLIKPARARLGRARNSTDASGESKNEDPVVGLRQG